MKTSDYEALLKERGAKFDEIGRLKHIARLNDIARNLESLGRLADAQAMKHELEKELVDQGVTAEEDSRALAMR